MALRDRAYSVLVVSSSDKFTSSMTPLLRSAEFGNVATATSASEARRLVLERPFDMILINAPLKDENGYNLSIDLCEGNTSVLVFVKSEIYDAVYHKVSPHGVLVLSKPASTQMVTQSLGLMCSTQQKLKSMEAKTATVEEKIKEIRLVNHAKWLLIECLNMTESDAHRFIEKKAMNGRISRKEVAESVIKTYS